MALALERDPCRLRGDFRRPGNCNTRPQTDEERPAVASGLSRRAQRSSPASGKRLTYEGACILSLRQWANRWRIQTSRIAVFFEDGDRFRGRLESDIREHFGMGPVFLPKSRSVAFQAADILAYEYFKAAKLLMEPGAVVHEDDLRKPFQELSRIPGGRDTDCGMHREALMRAHCEQIGIPRRQRAAGVNPQNEEADPAPGNSRRTDSERLMNLGQTAFMAPDAPAKPKHRTPPKKRRRAR